MDSGTVIGRMPTIQTWKKLYSARRSRAINLIHVSILLPIGPSLLSLATLVGVTAAANKQGGGAGINATVCQLVEEANRFRGKTVRLKALVESDLIEHTTLADESCESHGVSLWIPHDLDDNEDVKTLRKALREQWKPGAAKTRVSGVFTGTFSVEKKKRFLKVWKVEDIRTSGG